MPKISAQWPDDGGLLARGVHELVSKWRTSRISVRRQRPLPSASVSSPFSRKYVYREGILAEASFFPPPTTCKSAGLLVDMAEPNFEDARNLIGEGERDFSWLPEIVES